MRALLIGLIISFLLFLLLVPIIWWIFSLLSSASETNDVLTSKFPFSTWTAQNISINESHKWVIGNRTNQSIDSIVTVTTIRTRRIRGTNKLKYMYIYPQTETLDIITDCTYIRILWYYFTVLHITLLVKFKYSTPQKVIFLN